MGARQPITEQAQVSGSSQKKLLLAGPIGRRGKGMRTYPSFPEAATYLRNLFVGVLDPSDTMLSATRHTPYREHVHHHLDLFQQADGLVALPGWDGAILSQTLMSLAHGCHLTILHLDTHGGLETSEWGNLDNDLAWLPRPAGGKRIL